MGRLFVITHKHLLLFGGLLLLIGAASGFFFFERSYQHRFFPGVTLGGEAVGGATYDEVLSRIKLVGEALKTNGLQLIVPTDHTTTTIVIPQRSVGLTPDVVVEYFSLGDYEAAVAQAFAFGRTDGFMRRIREKTSLLIDPYDVPLPVTLREAAVESLLTREFDSLLKKPFDAAFVWTSRGITVTDEGVGEKVDVQAVARGIADALTSMKTNRLQLSVLPEPARVTKEELSVLKDFAEAMSRAMTFVFQYRGGEVYASGGTVATWLSVVSQPSVVPVIRREKLTEFIRQTINERIDDAPINSRFAMRDGKLIEIAPGTPGSVASIEKLAGALEQLLADRYLQSLFPQTSGTALADETVRLSVEFITEPPRITAATIANYNIEDLVGYASTSFKGSTASRKHNIATGVANVSGLLIAPGQEFSLVDAIGDVTEENGYEKEYVIKGDRSVKEAGGGLCQLATTVFRAAMNAGLPITERQNHSYVVGYYGPGLDATIYGPHPDLRFINDTGQYLLFQMKTIGDSLVAEFYGAQHNRVVTITEPKLTDYISPPPPRYIPALDKPWGQIDCTDQPRRGLTAEAAYTVQYPDGRVNEQVFKSVYQPWPKICLVGIAIGPVPVAANR